MEPFKPLHAVAAPLPVPNIDTDQIIPARFLWRKRGDGWGHLLFHDLRFDDTGSPRPHFVLNRPEFAGARILLADRNFGCGSSRETAVWALYDYGIRSVLAPSFGDIFFNNCLQNGLLAVSLQAPVLEAMMAMLQHAPGASIGIDLEQQCVSGPDGAEHAFEIDPFRKQCLLTGSDEVAFTLGLEGELEAFERAYESKVPWL